MSKTIDTKWLKNQAADSQSRQKLTELIQLRNRILDNNEFIKTDALFKVNLGKYKIWLREYSAFSTIEVYEEIFKKNNHFQVPGFSGTSASIIIDIGANEGFYLLKIKENNPACKIIAVEPSPYSFSILEKNVNANNLENVTLINKVVGQEVTTTTFECVKEIGAISGKGLRLINRPWLKDDYIEQKQIEMVTLEQILYDNGIEKVDILKIDVEGMEIEVLQGARRCLDRIDRIVVERHSKKLRDEIVTFLNRHGFTMIFEEDPCFEQYYGDLYFINKNINII